jgi:hypothetical protein
MKGKLNADAVAFLSQLTEDGNKIVIHQDEDGTVKFDNYDEHNASVTPGKEDWHNFAPFNHAVRTTRAMIDNPDPRVQRAAKALIREEGSRLTLEVVVNDPIAASITLGSMYADKVFAPPGMTIIEVGLEPEARQKNYLRDWLTSELVKLQ